MKIDKLITVFENLIPIYQKAVDTNADYYDLINLKLHYGICHLADEELKISIYTIFSNYYENYTKENIYLFPVVFYNPSINHLTECIISRLNFLKEQVIELNKLKQQGYTHV